MTISLRKFIFLVIGTGTAFGQGSQLPKYTVATAPAASSLPTYSIQMLDGLTAGDCTVGGGTYNVICLSHGGVWTPAASGSISGTTGDYALFTSPSVLGNGHLDETTNPGSITSTLPLVVQGSSHGLTFPAGSSPSGATGKVVYTVDATNGYAEVNENNTGLSRVCTPNNSLCGNFNPSTTNYVWVGDSRLMIATFNQVTATAASMNGTTVTITLPNVAGNWVDNTALVPGDSIQFFNNLSNWAPSCLAWGNATVLTASSTQVTVAENSLGPVTCTGSASGAGGVIQKANYLIPQATGREAYFNGHGTTYNMGVPGQTTSGIATQYTTYIHPLSPAVTGNPGFLFIQAGSQDALGCTTAATIETNLQSYWATAHADGWTIVETTLITTGPTISCASDNYVDAVNYWLRSQVKGYDQTLTTANKYWDQLVDVAEYVGDISDQNIFATGSEALHLNNGGTKTISSMMNLAMVSKGTIPPTPRAGYSLGERITDVTGSFGAGRGQSTFSAEAWNGNTTSGKASLGIDHATSSPTTSVGALWGPNNVSSSEDLAFGYGLTSNAPIWIAPSTGGYCWKNGTGGSFLSQQGTDSCFKRIAANEVAFGNGTSGTDASGQLDAATVLLSRAADPGSPVNGQVWYNTTSNLLKAYINGVVTTLGSGGGAVSSVSNSDGTLTISPTTGAVVASIALGHANTWSATQTFTAGLDASGSTSSKLRVAAGATSTANGEFAYDSTNTNWHAWNGADRIMAPLASGFVSGHCGQPTSTSGKWEIADTGSACGTGSGTGLSGMTAGQVPIAATATTVTSSKAIQGTDTSLLSSGTVSGTGASLCTDANGGATTSGCPVAAIGYGFTLNTGVAASPAFPNQVAPHTGTITTCKFLTQASDGTTDLTFNIKLAGTSILSGSTATITHGTSSQTITTLTLTGSISVTAGNIWEFDVTAGTSTWTGSLVCY